MLHLNNLKMLLLKRFFLLLHSNLLITFCFLSYGIKVQLFKQRFKLVTVLWSLYFRNIVNQSISFWNLVCNRIKFKVVFLPAVALKKRVNLWTCPSIPKRWFPVNGHATAHVLAHDDQLVSSSTTPRCRASWNSNAGMWQVFLTFQNIIYFTFYSKLTICTIQKIM
jgi:hypothetical protein